MAKSAGALTVIAVKSAAARAKPYRLFDALGLYLEVTPSGSKYWRFKYRFGGKEKRLALGVFPEVSLADARIARDSARAKLRDGVDPSLERRAERVAQRVASATSFELLAREWLKQQRPRMSPSTITKAEWILGAKLLPWLGSRPVGEITAPELLAVIRRIEATGANETAHRALQRASQIFRYAIATGRAERDPAGDLRGALAPIISEHRAALTSPAAIGGLLRAIDGYEGAFLTRCALKLSPLVFVRPGELRAAEWDECDLDAALWRLPSARMKMKRDHLVPLSKQAIAVLREIQPLTGAGKYVFPSVRTPDRPMSENTINAALRRMGFESDEMSAHGFRALASTRLNELGWATDVVERQLAHVERNKTRAAYNRAQHLDERRKMMQAWADYLDGLRVSGNVVPIRSAS